MIVAIAAGRHCPAFFPTSILLVDAIPGGAIAFSLLNLLKLRHTFRHFRSSPSPSFCDSATSASVPVTVASIVIVPPQTFYEPTFGALGRRSGRLGARPNGIIGETHDVAKHQRRNKIL
ncbi:hypothetical protein MRX96_027453 [Rhipicephalus microplus]